MNLSIGRGEFLLVLGQNGTGKSTWFKTVLGLLKPVAGRVELTSPRPAISYVPQAASLDPLLPLAARDVAMWGRLRGWRFLTAPFGSRDDREHVRTALRAAHADTFQRHAFADLSGGQQQRALFAQLLASEAELVFLDEPTASMDLNTEQETYQQLSELTRTRGITVVVITHTLASVQALADRVLFFDRTHRAGDGSGKPGAALIGAFDELLEHEAFEREFGASIRRTAQSEGQVKHG